MKYSFAANVFQHFSVELKMLSYEIIYERVGGDSLAQAKPCVSPPCAKPF